MASVLLLVECATFVISGVLAYWRLGIGHCRLRGLLLPGRCESRLAAGKSCEEEREEVQLLEPSA